MNDPISNRPFLERLLIFQIITFLLFTAFFIQLSKSLNNQVQLQNAQDYIKEHTYIINQDSQKEMPNFKVEKSLYVYFGLCILTLFTWIDYIMILYTNIYKLKKSNKKHGVDSAL